MGEEFLNESLPLQTHQDKDKVLKETRGFVLNQVFHEFGLEFRKELEVVHLLIAFSSLLHEGIARLEFVHEGLLLGDGIKLIEKHILNEVEVGLRVIRAEFLDHLELLLLPEQI